MKNNNMSMKTESTMTATFADKAEAVQFVTKALTGAKVIRVWFSDHFWNPAGAERYEVQVVTSDQLPQTDGLAPYSEPLEDSGLA